MIRLAEWHTTIHTPTHGGYFVFMLSTISPCTTLLKVLYDPSDCTNAGQEFKLLTFP